MNNIVRILSRRYGTGKSSHANLRTAIPCLDTAKISLSLLSHAVDEASCPSYERYVSRLSLINLVSENRSGLGEPLDFGYITTFREQ